MRAELRFCSWLERSHPREMTLAGLVSLVAELQPLATVMELACTLPVLVTLWSYSGSLQLICTSVIWTRALL